MKSEQCKGCNWYGRDGRCYADRKIKGNPLSIISYCDHANPPYALPGKLLKPIKK